VWNAAHDLTLFIYGITRTFPKEELFGLSSQLRRSTSSIGANIAEGCGRRSDRELTRFLQIARGSASETEYHLLLAKDLGFVSLDNYKRAQELIVQIQRMLTVLVQRIQPIIRDKQAVNEKVCK
jgi:four helix bundle protein